MVLLVISEAHSIFTIRTISQPLGLLKPEQNKANKHQTYHQKGDCVKQLNAHALVDW